MELLVVIAIIGLLSTIVMSSLAEARKRAAVAKSGEDFHTLRNALELYYSDKGDWPPANTNTVFMADTAGIYGNWSQLMTYMKAYVPNPIVPVNPPKTASDGTYGTYVSEGYDYVKGAPNAPVYVDIINSINGQYIACITIRKGYMLNMLQEKQTNQTKNDGGIDPDGYDVIEGDYTITTNPADCAAGR